jgi:hypothetical protein
MASVVYFSIGAFAQTTTQQTPSTTAAQEDRAMGEQVTVTGCIQKEEDYRRAQDAGKGGVAGTGLGAGNEFVLVNASSSMGASATTGAMEGKAAGTAGAASSTAGSAGTWTAYELTGSGEAQAAQHVGHRVEIMGKLKAAEVGASGRPTGGPTAGKPPEGVDVMSKDLALRELEVSSIKQVSGSCPAK